MSVPAASASPFRDSFVGQDESHVQGSPASRGVRDPAVVPPRQAAPLLAWCGRRISTSS
jgi:hypothetical protein